MGKAPLNKASIDTVNSANTRDAAIEVETPPFSNGELGQIQEILFGQQQRSTNEQISALQNQLDTQLNSLSNVLNSRLNRLTETVNKSQKRFEQQLSEIKADNQSTYETISESFTDAKAELQTHINALSNSNDENTKRFHTELAQHESKLLSNISATKRDLQTDIDRSIKGLHCTKLDKQDLAQLLNNLSEKLSDTPLVPLK